MGHSLTHKYWKEKENMKSRCSIKDLKDISQKECSDIEGRQKKHLYDKMVMGFLPLGALKPKWNLLY